MLVEFIGWDYRMDFDEHYLDLAMIGIDKKRRGKFFSICIG